MTTKKSENANLDSRKNIFMLMGLVMALSLVYISFEWSKDKVIYGNSSQGEVNIPDEDLIPITLTSVPPPPPPPPLPKIIDEFKIVEKPVENLALDMPKFNDKIEIPSFRKPEEPVEIIDEPQIWVEQMPEFNGNINKYLSEAINYPVIAVEIGLQGKVLCEFVVNKDGTIVDVRVVRGIDRSLDNEAMRVIKSMPAWKPGRMNGKAVRVKFTLPVNFRLM
jgi:periplasmic protein TonB